MVTAKKEVLESEYGAEVLVSKLRSLLEMGISSDFRSHNNLTWHNYLCVLDDIAYQLEEKIQE